MARPVTEKEIQLHYECGCGFNYVDHYTAKQRAKGLRRRIDHNGNVWYLLHLKTQCRGTEEHWN